MRLLGIDPGPTSCGWALIAVETATFARSLRVDWIDGNEITSSRSAFIGLLIAHRPDVIVIERPRWHGTDGADLKKTAGMAANLIETTYPAARFAEIAHCTGRPCYEIPAQTWRHGLLGRNSANDADVTRALNVFVRKMPKRSNAHKRDACGVALAAARAIANGQGHLYEARF